MKLGYVLWRGEARRYYYIIDYEDLDVTCYVTTPDLAVEHLKTWVIKHLT